jgi:hypothetical protein
MFDAPLDAWYVWFGVTMVSLAVLGVAIELPTAPPPPPNAATVTDTVDSVAGCSYTATVEHPLSARKIKLGPWRLGLKGGGGTPTRRSHMGQSCQSEEPRRSKPGVPTVDWTACCRGRHRPRCSIPRPISARRYGDRKRDGRCGNGRKARFALAVFRGRESMRRWSPARAQTEPVAAIVAVFAVCFGLLTYSGVLGGTMPRSERTLGPTTLSTVRGEMSSNGVLLPARLPAGLRSNPNGYHLNVSLSAGSQEWHGGPTPPQNPAISTETATASVSVRIAPGGVRPGRLRVVVWK